MLQNILLWLLAGLVLAVVSAIVNVILHLLRLGNVKTILFIRKLLRLLRGVPDDVLLSCQGKDVSALVFDAKNNKEKAVPLYAGVLTWHGGPRLVSRVRMRARRQLAIRSLLFASIFVPLVVAGLWAALFVDWKLLLVPAIFVFHQFKPFYIFDHPALSGLVD